MTEVRKLSKAPVRRYSGPKSVPFWDWVGTLKGRRSDVAYSLGVVLQNVEEQLFRELHVPEEPHV